MSKLTSFLAVFMLSSLIMKAQDTGTFKDPRDGKNYKTIKIGTQIWFAENLAFKPNEGNYWAYANNVKNVKIYGYLYDWQTAKKVAPKGWHLPSKEEWLTLFNRLGGKNAIVYENLIDGSKIGFNALFGGMTKDGGFKKEGLSAIFWLSTLYESEKAYNFCCLSESKFASLGFGNLAIGLSIRLIKD